MLKINLLSKEKWRKQVFIFIISRLKNSSWLLTCVVSNLNIYTHLIIRHTDKVSSIKESGQIKKLNMLIWQYSTDNQQFLLSIDAFSIMYKISDVCFLIRLFIFPNNCHCSLWYECLFSFCLTFMVPLLLG